MVTYKGLSYARVSIDGVIWCLSRFIMNYKGDNYIDHINGITLDNVRSNLRMLTSAQNSQNKSSKKNSSSKYVGVHYSKKLNKWGASLKHQGKTYRYGFFNTEDEAVSIRDKNARELNLQGNFYKINIPQP